MKLHLALALALFSMATAALPQEIACGGNFDRFVGNLKAAAVAKGHGRATVDRFFQAVKHDPRTIKADRSQGIFRVPFVDFSGRVISKYRLNGAASRLEKLRGVFDEIERAYGVSRGVLAAFWALETDFGQVQGDFNTLNSLVTLSHDCRRPEIFQPQVFAALELHERGGFSPSKTFGAWAGEIGMVQMLPEDILELGVDGDGDGVVDPRESPHDALHSAANMLRSFGWRAGEPWLVEVSVPSSMNWFRTGLEHEARVSEWLSRGVRIRQGGVDRSLRASLILPQGRKGPAFLALPNFRVLFEWNQSFVYVTSAAHFAARLVGAPPFERGSPEPGLSGKQMELLQSRLSGLGHDVGKIDGILGAKTRRAVRLEQRRLGLPADAWPTAALLDSL